jgi:hypothetical protein
MPCGSEIEVRNESVCSQLPLSQDILVATEIASVVYLCTQSQINYTTLGRIWTAVSLDAEQ